MARRVTPAEFQSMPRRAEQEERRRVQKVNDAIKKHNDQVRKQHREFTSAINKYNAEVRAHNARVHAYRNRVRTELSRLAAQPSPPVRLQSYTVSVRQMYTAYEALERRSTTASLGPLDGRVLDLAEREVANSLVVTNRLDRSDEVEPDAAEPLEDGELRDKLKRFSPELDDRWRGAVFALSPRNPDAARHFCSSAREIITRVIELTAPDGDVVRLLPTCERTDMGKPTRRSKLTYLLQRKGLAEAAVTEFLEQDMNNIVQLFHVLNDGTHGSAGTFTLVQLDGIRKRFEDGINFLAEIAQ